MFSEGTYLLITQWIAEGLTPAKIAKRIGCTLGTLRTMCSRHGVRLTRDATQPLEPHPDETELVPLNMTTWCKATFGHKAATMGLPTERLMMDCLERIAEDDLFLAVLDD